MRAFLFCIFLASASPVMAASWTSYDNPRFGFHVDVPPGLNAGPEPENGDGLTWMSGDKAAVLKAWGDNLVNGSFAEDDLDRQTSDEKDGWKITAFRGVRLNEPHSSQAWRFYTGTKAGRILYQRSMSACKGGQAIHVRIEYPKSQQPLYGPMLAHLVASMKAGPAEDCAN